ncbi:epidermal growth factor-like protein 6 [Palaemon carinicauda]|uniref:epidermal growth factor-like protein 6 n=1 Tax=Palaemon carinicauda TaxID=392227 RepID=UPI0035B572D2
MSGVIALAQKDECSDGSLPCGEIRICLNTLFSFTCSCPPGFTWDGSECVDVDECAEDKEDCVPNATCKNSIGSYSCSCNKPFKGDGISSCEFECISPAKVLTGLGCVKQVTKGLTYFQMNDNCQKDGWRFLQHMSQEQMDDVGHSFPTNQPWVGIYDGKWPSDESLVSEDLWMEGYLSDPSKPCGFITMDSPSKFL